MDKEFHYYITYLISRRAGYSRRESYIIAYSSQYVNDNDIRFQIRGLGLAMYRNEISQTLDVLSQGSKKLNIYPIFHYIPGDAYASATVRRDRRTHWLNTTAASANATTILDRAVESGNLFRIGIAIHAFADTFAHQNFVSAYDDFNSLPSNNGRALPALGHSEVRRLPDWPAAIWNDTRLTGTHEVINNKLRILNASRLIFRKLFLSRNPKTEHSLLSREEDALIVLLDAAIGQIDKTNALRVERVQRYIELSRTPDFGEAEIPEYRETDWLDRAVADSIFDLRQKIGPLFHFKEFYPQVLTWKDPERFFESLWYQFQEAIKLHRISVLEVLDGTNYAKTDYSYQHFRR